MGIKKIRVNKKTFLKKETRRSTLDFASRSPCTWERLSFATWISPLRPENLEIVFVVLFCWLDCFRVSLFLHFVIFSVSKTRVVGHSPIGLWGSVPWLQVLGPYFWEVSPQQKKKKKQNEAKRRQAILTTNNSHNQPLLEDHPVGRPHLCLSIHSIHTTHPVEKECQKPTRQPMRASDSTWSALWGLFLVLLPPNLRHFALWWRHSIVLAKLAQFCAKFRAVVGWSVVGCGCWLLAVGCGWLEEMWLENLVNKKTC